MNVIPFSIILCGYLNNRTNYVRCQYFFVTSYYK
nr:MAG TPA: hypothetical protein [Caudoviricetes sp.]